MDTAHGQHLHSRRTSRYSPPQRINTPAYTSWLECRVRSTTAATHGCSKRCCFCCTLWIEAYNNKFGTGWLTSGSHGKPYATWVLPGAACVHAIRPDGKSAVDATVLDSVVTRLTDTPTRPFPAQRRISNEHVSSGDGTRILKRTGDLMLLWLCVTVISDCWIIACRTAPLCGYLVHRTVDWTVECLEVYYANTDVCIVS